MTGESPSPPVLVYIPDQRASYLASEALRSGGFDSMRVGSISELELALEVMLCKVIVTITSKIGEVRELCDLPVVNIQVFVLPNIEPLTSEQSFFFDRNAFLERLRYSVRRFD